MDELKAVREFLHEERPASARTMAEARQRLTDEARPRPTHDTRRAPTGGTASKPPRPLARTDRGTRPENHPRRPSRADR